MFGFIPDDMVLDFQPLRELSAEKEEEVKTKQFERIQKAFETGAMSLEEYRDACNKLDLLGIRLENENLPEGSDEIGNIPGQEGEEGEEDAWAAQESERESLSFMKSPTTSVNAGKDNKE